MQLHGGNCVDSFKAVVLGLPQWWEDMLRKVYWSWKGVGITLGSKLVLEGCEHLIGYSPEACTTIRWSVPGLDSDSRSLGFATVVEGHAKIDILVLEGCGVTLDSRLVLDGCEHLGGYSFEMGATISWCAPGLVSLKSITELGGHVWRDTQAWKGQGTLVWVDSAWAQIIAGVQLGLVLG